MVVIIDNYDSFTYNLVHLVGAYRDDIKVVRNDEITLEELEGLEPTHIIISWPGYPKDAGICKELVQAMKKKVPILGICLGHQGICEEFGARIIPAEKPIHGKNGNIHIANGSRNFYGLPPMIMAGIYHSLIVDRDTLTDDLLIIAEDDEGLVMAVKHRQYEIYGLAFHPESILTPQGDKIIENFLKIGGVPIDTGSNL